MATVYRQKGRPNWMIAWYDSSGRRRVRSSGTSDRRSADRLAAKLEADSMLEREGIVDPRAGQFAAEGRRPILDHVEDFISFLKARGNTPKHAEDRRAQLRRLVDAMRANRLVDLTPARAQAGLAELRSKRKLALRTLNRYLVAIKSLAKWLVCEGRMESDPLVGLRSFNAQTDRRHIRRALTRVEVTKLVAAAERGDVVLGLSGPDRAMMYRLAVGTGLRTSELASLEPGSFDLDGDPPTVTVRAGYSKHRREDLQPMRRDLAESVRAWRVGRPEGEPLFDVPRLSDKTAKMMRVDLAAADIPYRDEDERVADFHSLRHSFVTEVVRAGASVKEAQTLARHQDPSLTFKVYAHARLHELGATLNAMPATPGALRDYDEQAASEVA